MLLTSALVAGDMSAHNSGRLAPLSAHSIGDRMGQTTGVDKAERGNISPTTRDSIRIAIKEMFFIYLWGWSRTKSTIHAAIY
jgi:hypothetical protein